MTHTAQQSAHDTASHVNGESTAHDLFALTDEQILEIEPQQEAVSEDWRAASENAPRIARPESSARAPETATSHSSGVTSHESQVTSHGSPEPPRWLADMMADPQAGGEARDLWNGIQHARQEAAAYREVFAKPEEARTAAERSRLLDQIDRAYFGTDGATEQTTASRAQLAQMMMREDPAAFREMVFAGLRALEDAGKQGSSEASVERKAAPTDQPSTARSAHESQVTNHEAHLAAYASFEKAANADLERSVGGAIERTLEQALPNNGRTETVAMRGRLAATIRQEVEKSLQDDRQLGEQVAQILSGRAGQQGSGAPRFDDEARAQVVRLIGERAQQLVPAAAKRVLNEWTQTTLAAHRGRAQRSDAALGRSEVAPASVDLRTVSRPPNSPQPPRAQRVDYGKLSDEQILNL